jgi:aryl-alcohol dehydrogenase-like predicted oxidoreductase
MTMLTSRLILGCARLTGGASESQALRLVRTALDAGVVHVDTAPSYGMGTAEAVVGKALRAHGGDIAVTAKLGSHRPRFGYAMSWLRRIRRMAAMQGKALDAAPTSSLASLDAPSGNDFSKQAMEASLAESLARLGRIDCLLLHDVTAPELTPALRDDLAALAAKAGAAPGYASRAQWDEQFDSHFAQASIAQCAFDPQWLSGEAAAERRPLFLHGIVKAGWLWQAQSQRFAQNLDDAARSLCGTSSSASRIALLYALAAQLLPGARFIVASSHEDRLKDVLASIASIEKSALLADVTELLLAPA